MTNYRPLLDKEIATLTVYGCSAEDWKQVQVVEDFSASYFYNVHFSGNVYLGTYTKVFELPGGVKKHSGIFNCHLHNCVIGNDVFIDKINNYIANFEIGDEAYIDNVNLVLTEGESTFGNGAKVPVMIEAGGREVPIFDQLSAPLAYMLTFYRYNQMAIKALEAKIESYVDSQKSNRGSIGKNVRITNCDSLKNVRIGDFAVIEGVLLLENGTVNCNEQAPVYIGRGVQCTNFIINSGTTVSESALISNCFVGQGCIISKQFSAIDSLFFANCQGLHGEAVSIFAGPYTVTHHKSTLMLTALYSFMNAGSGTNFSNHMYKLGPVHQGITERGVKTSSDSYIMWPAKIGAFTVVLGRHKGNPDISDLPFSYLLENDGESSLLPGINLHSAGTIRDVQKWPKRDTRTDEKKLDSINFDFLSPYTLSKAQKGIEIMNGLLLTMDASASFVWYQNCKIKRSSIKKGIELYEMAIDKFIGEKVVERLKYEHNDLKENLLKLLLDDSDVGVGEWVDMAGLIAPKYEVDKLLKQISTENISLEAIQMNLNKLHADYSNYSWTWAKNTLEKQLGKTFDDIEIQDIITIVEKWKKAVLTFNDLILRDAKKEFNAVSRTGFGMDGEDADKQLDFDAVRGTFDDNAFVKEINAQMNKTTEIAEKLIAQLENLKN
jgi:carbonic anhydrase/acetyltransferase-like protein (isoleucine patch superfamily)